MRLVREQLLHVSLRPVPTSCEQGNSGLSGSFSGYHCDLYTYRLCSCYGTLLSGENAQVWAELDKLPKFTESIAVLTPGTSMNAVITFLVALCFGLFAFTCLLGMISFSEIAANQHPEGCCLH